MTPRSTPRTSEPSKGGSHRTFASRPRPPGEQAPPHRRPARNPTRRLPDQRKPSRRHPAHASAQRDTPHPRASRTATSPTPPTLRRPRLRLRQVPAPHPGPRDHPQDRPPRHTSRLRPGQDPLGRRAHLRLAPPVQTTPHPLRDTSRPPPRASPTRLQHHLLTATPNLILKRSVRPTSPASRTPSVEALGHRAALLLLAGDLLREGVTVDVRVDGVEDQALEFFSSSAATDPCSAAGPRTRDRPLRPAIADKEVSFSEGGLPTASDLHKCKITGFGGSHSRSHLRSPA